MSLNVPPIIKVSEASRKWNGLHTVDSETSELSSFQTDASAGNYKQWAHGTKQFLSLWLTGKAVPLITSVHITSYRNCYYSSFRLHSEHSTGFYTKYVNHCLNVLIAENNNSKWPGNYDEHDVSSCSHIIWLAHEMNWNNLIFNEMHTIPQ